MSEQSWLAQELGEADAQMKSLERHEARRVLEELSQEIAKLKAEVAGYKQVSDRVRDLTQDYEAVDIDFIVGRLLRERQTALQRAAALEAEHERLRGGKDYLEQQLAKVEARLTGVTAERDRIQHETIVAGQVEFNAERNRRIAAEQSNAELRADNEDLQTRLAEAGVVNVLQEAQLVDTESELADLKTQVEPIAEALRYYMAKPSERKRWPEPGWSVIARGRAALANLQAQDQQEQEEGA